MPVVTLPEFAGLLIVIAVSLRAAIAIYAFAHRTIRTARLEHKHIQEFEALSMHVFAHIRTQPEKSKTSWKGKRKFQIVRREYENASKDICSFYLAPYDERPIAPFLPGQFLTFELSRPDQSEPIVRCYSLSDCPREEMQHYRISVKRLGVPPNAPAGTQPGLSSSYFHESLGEGKIIEVFAPSGNFCLDENSTRPLVFIAGGVGLTPIVSMLNWISLSKSNREIWFFYGVRNRAEHAMYDHLAALRRENSNIRMVVFYSRPSKMCRKGRDYDVPGHVNVSLMKHLLTARNYEFYICGPQAMIETVTRDLLEWGVPGQDIKYETFGTGTIGKPLTSQRANGKTAGKIFNVTFSRSGKTVQWTEQSGTLLELAEENGVKARCGCRQGICGTCVAGLKRGEVDYLRSPTKEAEPGACYPCITQPKGDLVIDI